MAYGKFKSLSEAAREYQVSVAVAPFISPMPFPVDDRFQQDLTYVQQNIDVRMSEAALSEFLIAPILKEVWKAYRDYLLLWSHVSLVVGEEFDGFPDYLFTKRTALGLIRDKPYLMVVEAKKDDFDGGWGQCLSALVATQTLNGNPQVTLHGIVSNGEGWEFGKLQEKSFVRDPRFFTISDLPDLFAALHYLFEQAKEQAARF
jgi:hypothetical protein